MMPAIRAAVVLCTIVASVLITFVGTPAQAVEMAAQDGRPVAPVRAVAPIAPDQDWGAPYSLLPVCTPGHASDEVGGWSGRRLASFRNQAGTGQYFRPVLRQIGEPCRLTEGSNTPNMLRIPFSEFGLMAPVSPVHIVATYVHFPTYQVVPPNVSTSAVKCASSEWSSSGTWRDAVNVTVDMLGTWPADSSNGPGGMIGFTFGSNVGCSHVQAVRLITCGYQWDAERSPEGVPRCEVFVWDADNWFIGQRYPEMDKGKFLCEKGANSSECVTLNPPDEYTFETVCGPGMPVWDGPVGVGVNVTDYWVALAEYSYNLGNGWLRHMAHCLFVPPAGFDRKGTAATAFDESAIVEVAQATVTMADALKFEGECGTLVSLGEVWPGAADISTCTWTSWSYDIRLALGFIMAVPFALWFVMFVLQCLRGVFGAQAIPLTPFENGVKP